MAKWITGATFAGSMTLILEFFSRAEGIASRGIGAAVTQRAWRERAEANRGIPAKIGQGSELALEVELIQLRSGGGSEFPVARQRILNLRLTWLRMMEQVPRRFQRGRAARREEAGREQVGGPSKVGDKGQGGQS